MSTLNNATPHDIDRLARKRAAAKMGWYVHALVYIAVNVGLVLLSSLGGRNWAMVPALGWGLGLLTHGMVVFVSMPGGPLRDRLVAKERARLLSLRDPW